MSFKYPSNYILLFNSRLKYECASHIFHPAVKRLGILQFIINSYLSLEFECPSDNSKVRIVAFNYSDSGHRKFKKTHRKAFL